MNKNCNTIYTKLYEIAREYLKILTTSVNDYSLKLNNHINEYI